MTGLIPQAPLHTSSLVIMGHEETSSASSETAVSPPSSSPREHGVGGDGISQDEQNDMRLSQLEAGGETGTEGM